MTEEFFESTKLDSYLVVAIRDVIKGNYLPRNPFPRILRSLKQSLWFNTSVSDANKRRDAMIENFLDDNELGYSIYTTKRKVDIYGYKLILSKVNIENIQFIRRYMADSLQKRYEKRGEYEVRALDPADRDRLLAERQLHSAVLRFALHPACQALHRDQPTSHHHRADA